MKCENFYINYGQAILLKKLEFDYPVDTFYCIEPFYGINLSSRYEYKTGDIIPLCEVNKSISDKIVPQWTVDQVLRWFRVKYNIDIELSFTSFKTWAVHIEDNSENPLFDPINMDEEFTEHIDGEIAAIDMVLSKLIKNNSKLIDDYITDVFMGKMNCK